MATLIEAHKILHDAKENSAVDLRPQPISIPDIKFVAFSDASFASEKVPDSHQGMMIMAAHQRIGENQKNPINPIYWHSKKIQRVAINTLSAEAMALAGAVDSLSWVRLYWAWLVGTRSRCTPICHPICIGQYKRAWVEWCCFKLKIFQYSLKFLKP